MYTVKLEQFEGPLDLLLHLVDKNRMDITEISLAAIAGEYEAYIRRLRELRLEVESSFLTVFASLLEIKSKLLLPVPPKIEQEEEKAPEEHELVRKLREYRSFREAADLFTNLKKLNESSFVRMETLLPNPDEPVLATQISREDLLDIYIDVMRKCAERKVLEATMEVVREKVSISFILKMITRKIRNRREVEFHELFDTMPDRVEFVITFIALLELAKRNRVSLVQEDNTPRFLIINISLEDDPSLHEEVVLGEIA